MIDRSIHIGARYSFAYPIEFVTLPEYSAHRGVRVTVIRPLTENEAAGPEQDMPQMYRIRADDGWEGDAWEDELEALEDDCEPTDHQLANGPNMEGGIAYGQDYLSPPKGTLR